MKNDKNDSIVIGGLMLGFIIAALISLIKVFIDIYHHDLIGLGIDIVFTFGLLYLVNRMAGIYLKLSKKDIDLKG